MVLNFLLGRHVAKNRPLLVFGITCNILLICYFKYSHFILENLSVIVNQPISFVQVALPLGISFFTFQQIAYLIDTFHDEKPEHNFIPYALLVSFFPHSIAGPLVQYKEIAPQLKKVHLSLNNVIIGISIFILGLFKKTVLADGIAPCVTEIFNAASNGVSLSFAEGWTGGICYTLQLYFDFSGYSDMAIGLAKIFNIQFPLNFNSPYKATSIIDFWRRWHITLSTFLRDYIYIPLGGNRKGYWLKHINLLLTMLIGGLWHGANWTFILWGFLHGILLIINHVWRDVMKRLNFSGKNKSLYTTLGWFLTMVCVIFLWVLFKADSLDAALVVYKSMLGFNGISLPLSLQKLVPAFHFIDYRGFFHNQLFDMHQYVVLIGSALFICLCGKNLKDFFNNYLNFDLNNPQYGQNHRGGGVIMCWRPSVLYAVIFAIMSAWILLIMLSSRKLEFLYFNF